MSTTLFCVALTLLKASRKDAVKLTDSDREYTVDKVWYMDGIKIFGETIKQLDRKVAKVQNLSKLIGLEYNSKKSSLLMEESFAEIAKTTVIKDFPVVGTEACPTYKYLGFKQIWVNGKTTKEEILTEAKKRLRRIAYPKLTVELSGRMMRNYVSPLVRFISQ